MDDFSEISICRRVAQVRLETCGPRGKAAFARRLGISPSTYDYYEAGRVPPAELLVKIAEVGGVDLRWLLTGQAASEPAPVAEHPAVRRVAAMLAEHPGAAEPLTAFLDILAGTLAFPARPAGGKRQAAAAGPACSGEALPRKSDPAADTAAAGAPRRTLPDSVAIGGRAGWIPILGRSAAGVPCFWAAGEDTAGLTTLRDLIDRCRDSVPAKRFVFPARAFSGSSPTEPPRTVEILTLRTPLAWGGGKKRPPVEVAEFLVLLSAAGELSADAPDAFALRIDGDSMAPEIRHGDLVVLRPSCPAAAGQPAVVQVRGAVGVTCKLYHPDGPRVHLVPINEQVPPITVSRGQIEWAFRVLARVRPAAGEK